ncbi:glycosyltransferase family 2 protein [Hanamia caeni]|jgi:glycosyltransferase involved in cell wall biosynthesis|uniref:Glycosyltransferase family 2 protein n=1 Tax=Hanamia caeni TaxID=2294116 RepID=A0A3M9N5A2_9BACT|nr:glycosyltransferase family 2 protein [Hanamia caeni]RNI32178.1 glycosyltransferase family 2 protein [Hanamia caeni]
MNKFPLVSIIIPVYNAEHYLSDCIESLLQQTYLNKEIVIVDDSSTDESYLVAKKFESEIVKVCKQTNSGAAVARNTGLEHAKGDYIQFIDVDDFLSADKIEKQVAALEGEINKVAVCDYINFFDGQDLKLLKATDQSSFIYSSDNPVEFLLNMLGANGESNFIQTNSWLVPRTVIDKSGRWRNYRSVDDDGEFFTRVLLASDGIIYVPDIYNYYRRSYNENKLSSNTKRKYLQNALMTIDLKYLYISRFASGEKVRMAFARQYLDFAVYNYQHQRILSKIAYKKYKALQYNVPTPMLGGRLVEFCARILGWRFVVKAKYYLSER